MVVCPVCKTKAKKENQEFCLNCAWELEYYFTQLSDEEKKRYREKLKIAKKSYSNKTPTAFIGSIVKIIFSSIKWILILLGIFFVLIISLEILAEKEAEQEYLEPELERTKTPLPYIGK